MLGSGFGWIGAHQGFVSVFKPDIYPYLNVCVTIYPIVITYAILRYKLLDISVVVKKGVAYSVLITGISIAYIMIVIILEKYLQTTLRYTTIWFSLMTAFLIGIAFNPIRILLQKFIDKSFFKGTAEEIAEQNALFRQEAIQMEKYKTLGTLATGMAHEVKNPLTAILTFSDKLPQNIKNEEFLNKFARIVPKEAVRINELINDLLDYGKPSPLQLKSTNINELIRDTLEFLSNRCVQNKIQTEVNLSEDITEITIDDKQLRQAILNILLNAIDAMPNGGSLTIRTTSDARQATITIADTGCGIDPKDALHIFDPFFTKKDHGTGLGLAITRSIIENHGGKISVKSQVGVGTEFLIVIPIDAK